MWWATCTARYFTFSAGHVCGGRTAGISGDLHSHQGGRIALLAAGTAEQPSECSETCGRDLGKYLGTFIFLIVLMFAFNSYSQGTRMFIARFLQKNRRGGVVAIVYNLGALLAGFFCFGSWSERLGRRKAISAAFPMIPLWVYPHTASMLAFGSFLMQFMVVQGAWGVDSGAPVSPPPVRGTFLDLRISWQFACVAKLRGAVQVLRNITSRNFAPVLAWTAVLVSALVVIVTISG